MLWLDDLSNEGHIPVIRLPTKSVTFTHQPAPIKASLDAICI